MKGFESKTRKIWQDYFESFTYRGDPHERFSGPHPEYEGPFGKPLGKAGASKYLGNRKLFSARYSFDRFGRRRTPSRAKAREFAIFFGSTLLFGEGVGDSGTVPSEFQRLRRSTQAYNYGFFGLGPQNFLRKAEHGFTPDEIPQGSGVVFCQYRDETLAVARGKVPWSLGFPRYELDEQGRLARSGKFEADNVPAVQSSYMVSDYTERDYAVTAALFAELRRRLMERFPGTRFLVVVEPVVFSAPWMLRALENAGVEALDLAIVDLETLSGPQPRPSDLTLHARAAKVMARFLQLGIENPGFVASLKARRELFNRLVIEQPDPERAAFNGGFAFNDLGSMPPDDAHDLVMRCAKRSGALSESAMNRMLQACQMGFNLRKAWRAFLRMEGILGRDGLPGRIPSLDEFMEHLGNTLLPRMSDDQDDLLRFLYGMWFEDYALLWPSRSARLD